MFCEKADNFVHFGPYDLVQTSVGCCPNTYQIMYGETYESPCQHLQRHATVARKSLQIYCKNCYSNLAFYVTVTDADIESLKSLHILFDKHLDHILVKVEQNRIIENVHNFELFFKK